MMGIVQKYDWKILLNDDLDFGWIAYKMHFRYIYHGVVKYFFLLLYDKGIVVR